MKNRNQFDVGDWVRWCKDPERPRIVDYVFHDGFLMILHKSAGGSSSVRVPFDEVEIFDFDSGLERAVRKVLFSDEFLREFANVWLKAPAVELAEEMIRDADSEHCVIGIEMDDDKNPSTMTISTKIEENGRELILQIRQTKFNHPEQTEGQHANGPPSVFVKAGNGHWFIVDGFMSISKIESSIEKLGFELFVNQHCQPIKDLT